MEKRLISYRANRRSRFIGGATIAQGALSREAHYRRSQRSGDPDLSGRRYPRSGAERYPRVAIGFLLVLGIGLAFMTGCVYEGEFPVATSEEEALVAFTIQMPGRGGGSTRATTPATGEEDAVGRIDILCFRKNGGAFVYRASCLGGIVDVMENDTRYKTFTISLRQGEYDMVILANAGDIIEPPSGGPVLQYGMTKDVALKSLKKGIPPGERVVPPLPMWGDIGNITISGQTGQAIPTGGNPFLLHRMVARADVRVTGAAAAKFQLKSVRLYNYNTRGLLVPYENNWDPDEKKAVRPSVPADLSVTKGPIVYEGEEYITGVTGCTAKIYLFEAENYDRTEEPATLKSSLQRTCLVVGGIYNDGSGFATGDTPTNYYRVDFSNGSGINQTDYRDLLRNHCYEISITDVLGPGSEDPGEAFESVPVNIQAEVVDWYDGEMGGIIVNPLKYLTVEPTVSTFEPSGGEGTFTVTTDQPTGWTYTYEGDSSDWIEVTDITPNTFEVDIPQTVTFSVKENTGPPRRGFIIISIWSSGSGNLRVRVEQSGVVTGG